jgi:NAD(P)-dependent dehydrogenase (short-subunit alcohol dehydrogenase family)
MDLAGKTAVVTGAASGIGRQIALALGRRGCHLALADLDAAGLAQTEDMLGGRDLVVSRHRLDVADAEAVAALPAHVLDRHTGVDLLINNAGVALGGTFEEVDLADFEWLFEINFWGLVRMTRAFLPHLRRAPDASLVNVSSLFGLIAPPGQAAYAASKFAVNGFSQALRHELRGSNVGLTIVHPGGVATGIAQNARRAGTLSAEEDEQRLRDVQRLLRMPPERAGEIIVAGVERRRQRVLVGGDAKIAALVARLAPVSYWRLLELAA